MACSGTTTAVQKRLTAYSATPSIQWFTDWTLSVGMDEFIAVMKAKQATSQYFEAQVVMQYAAVRTDNPDTPMTKGTLQTPQSGAFEYNTGRVSTTSDANAKLYVRWGVAYNFTSGQAQSAADVELEVQYRQCGSVVGSATATLGTMTQDDQILPVTGWLSCVSIDAVKLAIVVSSLSGNIRLRFAYRTALTSKEDPSAWSTVPSTPTYSANGEGNSGDLAVTLNTMWVQLGILYDLSSGSNLGQATITAVAAARAS